MNIQLEQAKRQSWLQAIVVLFKLRVVSLLLLAAVGGAFLTAAGWPGMKELAILLLSGGMTAAGASGFNQYWERESDKVMGRTRLRPLVTGRIKQPLYVLWGSLFLIIIPIIALLPFNIPLAVALAAGAFIYVVIYTIWLKRRTMLNIVIGGAAGSAAVLSGAAVTGHWDDPMAWVLAGVLFLWTPCHFWALAILYRADYQKAEIPMLSAQIEPGKAAWWVLSHTIPTTLAALALVFAEPLGWVYFIPVFLFSVELWWRNWQLLRTPEPMQAKRFFLSSNIYLAIVLVALCVDTLFI